MTALLVLSVVINALPFLFMWITVKPENEMLNMLWAVVFFYLLPTCMVLGGVLALLVGIFSKGLARKITGFAIASLDLLPLAIGLLAFAFSTPTK
jgi:hypothetical protein